MDKDLIYQAINNVTIPESESAIYAAQIAAIFCYEALKDTNELGEENIFTSPEVLAAAMQIAYKEIQYKRKKEEEFDKELREK